jgi:DNA replication protein DnaC
VKNAIQTKTDRICYFAKKLKLPVFGRYNEYVDTQISFEDALLELLEAEIEERTQRKVHKGIKKAGFPVIKSLDTFNMDRLPNLKREQVQMLITGEFVKDKRNCIAFGNPGTGKTHLLISIGLELIKKGYSVKFTKAAELVTTMIEEKDSYRLGQYQKRINKCDLLLIDEMGYIPFSQDGARLLFQLIADRYETKSTMITTNMEFSKWHSFLGEETLVEALIDRLAHRTIYLNMNGSSYRYQSAKTPYSSENNKS